MRLCDSCHLVECRLRPGGGAARLHADGKHHKLIGGCPVEILSVISHSDHRVEQPELLRIDAKDQGFKAEHVTFTDFLQLVHVCFDNKGGDAKAVDKFFTEIEVLQEGICRVLEREHVVRDIHVPVVVDPGGLNRFLMEGQGGAAVLVWCFWHVLSQKL